MAMANTLAYCNIATSKTVNGEGEGVLSWANVKKHLSSKFQSGPKKLQCLSLADLATLIR
jgi:hypothetical protein